LDKFAFSPVFFKNRHHFNQNPPNPIDIAKIRDIIKAEKPSKEEDT
jgi:hypothetical protein